MTNNNCLNCEKELLDKYCSGCGQKADTHRISFKNFVFHDLLHGTFHFEKGMLFTAKQALLCPGQAALDYIAGKRKRYYNVFYLILIMVGLILFIRHFYEGFVISQGGEFEKEPYLNEASKRMDEILSQKSKIIIFLFVPFAAFNSFMVLRRKKLNLSEHAIVAGMILLGILLLSALGNILFCVNLLKESETFSDIISLGTPILIVLYVIYGYYNAFAADYSKIGIAYRILSLFALLCLETAILLYLLIGFATHWKYGTVNFSLF
jgi:hypothetical protein